jgi:hypothetical protein
MHPRPREGMQLQSAAQRRCCARRRSRRRALVLLGALIGLPSSARAIVTANIRNDTGSRVIVNVHVGADRFYNAGYYGSRAVIANIEAGHVWNGHETLGHVQTYFNAPSIDSPQRQYDFHATMVGFVLNGLGPLVPGVGYYYYQFGMAPGATLASGAIATSWAGEGGQFHISDDSFTYAYRSAMETGVQVPLIPGVTITRKADVINSSWGFYDNQGTHHYTRIIDALAHANRTTVVLAAGNHISGNPPVVGPASGYNSISVAALSGDLSTPAYSSLAWFSNSAPNDFFNPVTGQVIAGARVAVDIAAPGTDLVLAAYTGTTGANGGGTDPYNLADNLYAFGAAGTSFSSPTVAGGAALLVDAGYDRLGGGTSVDALVIKAILLNSASKIPGWNNNTSIIEGVITTTQGLDLGVGAGALNLDRAFDQYLAGTTDLPGLGGGSIGLLGWDYGQVGEGAPTIYRFASALLAGQTFTATLDWFMNRRFDPELMMAFDVAFQDLNLEVWRTLEGELDQLVAQSASIYNNVEHLYFQVPADGDYALVVRWAAELFDLPGNTPNSEFYGVAWHVVPEPGVMVLLLAGGFFLLGRQGRRATAPAEAG